MIAPFVLYWIISSSSLFRDRGATLRLGGGGGGTISDSILGGRAQNTFSYKFFIILKILGEHVPPPPPLPLLLGRGPCFWPFVAYLIFPHWKHPHFRNANLFLQQYLFCFFMFFLSCSVLNRRFSYVHLYHFPHFPEQGLPSFKN